MAKKSYRKYTDKQRAAYWKRRYLALKKWVDDLERELGY